MISEAADKGASVWAKDQARWNERGHRIANYHVWKTLKPIIKYPDSVLYAKKEKIELKE